VRYGTPAAFKAALEQRLRDRAAGEGAELQRLRQLLVFDRFLARLFACDGTVILKGGLVLELRVHPVPARLPDPPDRWEQPYVEMARADRLPWPTLAEAVAAARQFLDPVLSGGGGSWDPARWTWDLG
jgi:hypothetical protein